MKKAAKSLELWFEFASTYSYLSVMRIDKVAAAVGLEVVWRPFLLGPIFKQQGWDDSPFNLYPVKGRYMWRDMERLCEGYELPFQKPSVFPRSGLLAARIATVAEREGWCPELARAVFHANFAEDREIGESAVLSSVLEALGREPGPVLAAAESTETKTLLRARTEQAVEIGIFGAPSFLVGDELFWGNDRLGDAIARAALP